MNPALIIPTAMLALTAVLLAGDAQLAEAQDRPDRSVPPSTDPAPSLALPDIHKHTLSNGLPVWIVEMHEVPVVDVTVIVKSGATSDPAGRFGTASFTAAMLDEGAGSRDALELADAIEILGASLTTGASYDASTVQLHTLAETFEQALPLLADVVLRPTFPAAEVDRLRAERLTTLVQLVDDPAQLASAAFSRVLYGPQHRYGTTVLGTRSANESLSADDLRAFHTAHYRPDNAHILVVGDVVPADVLASLERAFGSWTASGPVPPAPALDDVAAPTRRRVFLIDKPGAPQSQIRIGTIGVARATPEYHAIEVANTMLGGSFSSRLNMNLRERNGYSYGAGSQFAMRRAAGPFVALAGVQSDKTREALVEFVSELQGMGTPPAGDELTRVRNLEALGFPRGFETTRAMAARLAELVVYDLPESAFEEYVDAIQAVTAEDVARVGRERMPADRMVVVVVGDLASIEAPIRAGNFGEVTVVPAGQIVD
jgi:zinc protease